MTECVPHPEDPTRWLPVADAISILWRDHLATLALIEGHDTTLADLDARLAAQRSVLSDLTARADGTDKSFVALRAEIAATVADLAKTLTGRLDTQQADNAALRVELDALKSRIAALEPAPTGPAFGVDVSGHQTLDQVKAAAADPVNGFVIVKATEGLTWRSDVYAAQVAAVRAAGKRCGAYHFAWANQDPVKEATNFLAGANLQPGDIAALDLERADAGETWAVRVAYAIAWCDEVKAKSGATPVVYLNWSWIKGMRTAATQAQWDRLTKYPLWLAEWTLTAGDHSTVTSKDGTNPDSWPIVIHQYGVVSNLDRNWTPDTARLAALAV